MTECVAPDKIKEGDLLAFLEGEAPAAVQAHVARCLHCRNEVTVLQQMNTLFAAALGDERANCPETDELLQYQAGLLNQARQQRVQVHLKTCDYCQDELAELS